MFRGPSPRPNRHVRLSRRLLALLLSWGPLLVAGPLLSLAGSITGERGSGGPQHLGALPGLAALLSLIASVWGIRLEPRPWKGWRIWPFFCAIPAALLLAGLWWLYLR